jgi:aconitate hydratase
MFGGRNLGRNVTQKILENHLIRGEVGAGKCGVIKIDNVLMQDATGTMATLQFMEMGVDEVQPDFVICYIDHNMIQLDYRNPEDHRFLKSAGRKYGFHVSLPGNGICHQVNTERFATPGGTLLGSDSHTPTSGGVSCLGIGAGGLDVALALAGHGYELPMPKVVGVHLTGEFQPWVSSKDMILELLRRYTVKGGLGKVYEFTGPSVEKIPVTGRATVSNMITELGATSVIFPSDDQTKVFLKEQQREHQWVELKPDKDADYDEEIEINLSEVVPLIAKPHNPDNVVPVEEVAGLETAQACLGSSVNSWFDDLALPAAVLAGKGRNPGLDLTVSPGSRQILDRIARSGALENLIHAGARILEPACGPCVGMGQAPPEGKPSVRTFNRNFRGRSGTKDDQVYLCSPATAAATALKGVITDPRTLGEVPAYNVVPPIIDDSMIIQPLPMVDRKTVEIEWGRNIKRPPEQFPLPDSLDGKALIKLGDNISTGSMSPAGVIVMADRSNIEAISRYVFEKEDPEFVNRAEEWGGGFIVAGENYGQGSSREHAAMAPKHLGVKAVLAKSIHRIHRRNLLAQGLIPMVIDDATYDEINLGENIRFPHIRKELETLPATLTLSIGENSHSIKANLTEYERDLVLAGGARRWAKLKAAKGI